MLKKIRELCLPVLEYRWQIIGITIVFILPIALWGIVEIRSLYLLNSTLVNRYLDSQALNFPAGIYAASRQILVGQQLNQAEIRERLFRAGYEEGSQTNDFAAGSFTTENNVLEIHTSDFATNENLPKIARIEFNKNTVSRLVDNQSKASLKSISLPAEMLSADFESRRQTRRTAGSDEIPQSLLKALLVTEDKNFFSHNGFDVRGIIRAAFQNFKKGGIGQGGSTLTQQLVKNHFLSPERTYSRKINEIMMAIALERRLTKQQILALYCDRVYLGHSGITSVYGFKQGARVYFGKKLKDLDTAEAALLVGLIKAPNKYSPYLNSDSARTRRNLVLNEMAEAGAINKEEYEFSKNEPLAVLAPQTPDAMAAPYFIDYVRHEMNQSGASEHLQGRVETTLDLDLQQVANETVQNHLKRLGKILSTGRRVIQPEAAIVALDPQTGDILAMTGGRDYASSQLNRAVDAHRQPGSVFKPIVYATALSQGVSPATTFMNAPQEFSMGHNASYRPQNFGHSYTYQPVMLRESLVRSLNVVTVEAALQTGLGNIAKMAEKMGLPRPETYPSMALGAVEVTPLEIASAYTTFANRGIRVEANAIRKISRQGVIEAEPIPAKTGVISSTSAYLVTDALMDVVNRGTAAGIRRLGYRGPAAGKTGTSRDAWFVGYTPKLVVAVWVGNDDNEDLRMTGGEAAAPIWADFMKRVIQLRPDLIGGNFTVPAGMEVVELCASSGGLANEYCLHQQTMLLPPALFPPACNEHQAPQAIENFNAEDDEIIDAVYSDEPVNKPKLPEKIKSILGKMKWFIEDK